MWKEFTTKNRQIIHCKIQLQLNTLEHLTCKMSSHELFNWLHISFKKKVNIFFLVFLPKHFLLNVLKSINYILMISAAKVVFIFKLIIDKLLYPKIYLGSTLQKKGNAFSTKTSYLYILLSGEFVTLLILFNLKVKSVHNFAFLNFTGNAIGDSLTESSFFIFF